MTEPPYGDPPPRRDVFAPAPRPRPRPHRSPEPTPAAAYPSLPQPGSYGEPPQLYGEPVVPPYSPPWHQAPYAPYPYPPMPASTPLLPRRRRWPWISLALVVLLAAGSGIFYFVNMSTSPHRIPLPATLVGYTRLHNANATSAENTIRAMGGNDPSTRDAINHVSIGVYAESTGDVPGLVVFVIPASVGGSNTLGTQFEAFIRNAATNVHDYPAGVHSGSLVCGTLAFGRITETLCTWDDAKTVGLIEAGRPSISLSQGVAITNALRDAVDH